MLTSRVYAQEADFHPGGLEIAVILNQLRSRSRVGTIIDVDFVSVLWLDPQFYGASFFIAQARTEAVRLNTQVEFVLQATDWQIRRVDTGAGSGRCAGSGRQAGGSRRRRTAP